ncbi:MULTISPECIES: cupin domain-containing protein [Paraburkholderia]|jgi:mannose-6-phosphate isomerase-like protein (cupin superfamily)|uniref:Mannose-6-phosphate isomerase, cupin superfamily n=1 Tax=Paraburkholderia tropica TaxID=92647 RepID=A0A1A5X384_9BURK|nr:MULTISPECIES: cupin domain-containing protein [Paraburkholderia]MBB2983868.1 mannose-6-phosphate isomerase-like protein (cupin superfamily) [Paraburkholderia tropica]MBB3002820.1 mannose-6-phosphate isomerase-like protein (cupin superfamily) [Paraburkholderia tropica]MBB6320417.1 mannose-6-phosphate isomerase-like protein (cupin superfamily) [Paraburkholderia tropica]MDE1138280.1 cupin domain-containing protein [Paraburkholderia tropica]OBR47580.1 cupin [Paraburkholderia tropica]
MSRDTLDTHAARGQRHAIALHGKFERIESHWGQHVIAEMNDHQFRIVRLQGDFLWRTHVESDETYFVFDGELRLDFRDRSLVLRAGEMAVVPKGIEHKPYAADEVKLLLIARRSVDQSGEARWI